MISPINRGVPQGNILEPTLFSIIVVDTKVADISTTLLAKCADNITLSTYRSKNNYDCPYLEANPIKK